MTRPAEIDAEACKHVTHDASRAQAVSPLLFVARFVLLGRFVLLEQVAERLGRDGRGVGEDDPGVAAGGQHQLVVEVVEADTPHPV